MAARISHVLRCASDEFIDQVLPSSCRPFMFAAASLFSSMFLERSGALQSLLCAVPKPASHDAYR